MHYILLPLVKTGYQIFLCWSLFRKTFVLMSGSYPDQLRILRWEQNRILVVREKGSHIKMFDDTSRKICCILLWGKLWCFVTWHWYPQNIDVWLEKCKETQSYNYLVKLQRLGSPPHRYYTGILPFMIEISYINHSFFSHCGLIGV